MTVRIMIGDALSQLAELPDESVHCVMTWAASGAPVRGSERRDAVPTQSHRNTRVRSNGKTNTGLLGCPAHDFVCSGLCGECQDALRVRTPHNDCTPPPPQQSSSASANAARDMDCSGWQVTETSQPALPASSTPQSSRLLPGASMPEQSPEASALPSAEPSSLPGVPASACKGCGRGIPGRARPLPLSECRNRGMGLSSGAYSSYSTAPHKPKDLIDMPGYVAEALRADAGGLFSSVVVG